MPEAFEVDPVASLLHALQQAQRLTPLGGPKTSLAVAVAVAAPKRAPVHSI